MSYCINPDCLVPDKNSPNGNFCTSCGKKILLKDRYRALELLGQGGFGKTFKARDEDQPRKPLCVIKQFSFSNNDPKTRQTALKLFYEEAQYLEALGKHDQIPELLAYFDIEGQPYLIQQFIDGCDLEQELATTGTFNQTKIYELLESLLPVLDFLHHQSPPIIHRDIKPANMIRRRSDGELVLVDFGAAKQATQKMLAKTGTVIGSPEYVALEQLRGKPTFASDIYSLGVTCLHLLTQVSPFDLFDMSEDTWVWRDYLVNNSVDEDLGRVLDRMIDHSLPKRYKSAIEVLTSLLGDLHWSATQEAFSQNPETLSAVSQELPLQNPKTFNEHDSEECKVFNLSQILNSPARLFKTIEEERRDMQNQMCGVLSSPPEQNLINETVNNSPYQFQPRLNEADIININSLYASPPQYYKSAILTQPVADLSSLHSFEKALDEDVLKELNYLPTIECPVQVSNNLPTTQFFEFDTAKIQIEELGNLWGHTKVVIEKSCEQSQQFIEDFGDGISLEMVAIPGGSFLMGAPESELENNNNERPQHQVQVPAFFMSKYLITEARYQTVIRDRSYPKDRADLPMKCRWEKAVAFCEKLSKGLKRNYRLPSEAEWEYACRAGTTTPFYFGETIDIELAHYSAWTAAYGRGQKVEYYSSGGEKKVGTYPANTFGLYDMHGNTPEWCADTWHDNYIAAPTDGSAWFYGDKRDDFPRLVRGGGCSSTPIDCRSASRKKVWEHPDIVKYPGNYYGFRVVCCLT
jgi:eukaryotic-like serine/threonine-protein kinase